MKQKEEFVRSEADAWFERNKAVLLEKKFDNDIVVELIKDYQIQPNSILEVGSSAGYKLNYLKGVFPDCNACGIDPSGKAIQFGTEKYPELELRQATVDDMSFFDDESFDLVIVGFVFYVVDRNLLVKSMAEIDRVLKNKGNLIILDFFSDKARRNHYAHITSFDAFSYKHSYEQMFLATNMYQLLDKSTLDHSTRIKHADDSYSEKIALSLLKKDINACY